MDLAAVDLEGFERGQRVSLSVAVAGVAEIQAEKDEAEFFIDSGQAVRDVRVCDDRLSLDVFAAGARAGTSHVLAVLDAVGIGREWRIDSGEGPAGFEPDRIE